MGWKTRMFWLLLGIGCSLGEGLFWLCWAISRRSLLDTVSSWCASVVMMILSPALSLLLRRERILWGEGNT